MRSLVMIDLTEVHSLTDFQRNARAHIKRHKRSGQPAVLTVNGKAEVIVQDAASYQRLLDAVDRADAIAGINRGLRSMARGKGRPADEVLEAIRRKYKIPRGA